MVAACAPGAAPAALVDAAARAGAAVQALPVVRGLGLGVEPPVAGGGVPAGAAGPALEAGMVLALCTVGPGPPGAAALAQVTVVVTPTGCTPLVPEARGAQAPGR